MKIKILFFAQLRDAFGKDERLLEVEEGTSVLDLKHRLMKGSGLEKFESLPMAYAINENYVTEDEILHDQDTLVMIPPIAGG